VRRRNRPNDIFFCSENQRVVTLSVSSNGVDREAMIGASVAMTWALLTGAHRCAYVGIARDSADMSKRIAFDMVTSWGSNCSVRAT
jgi:hypothetical protein